MSTPSGPKNISHKTTEQAQSIPRWGPYKKVLYLGSAGPTSPLPLGKKSQRHHSLYVYSPHFYLFNIFSWAKWRGRRGSGGLPLLPSTSLSLCSVLGSLQAQLHPSYPPSACSTFSAKSSSSSPSYNSKGSLQQRVEHQKTYKVSQEALRKKESRVQKSSRKMNSNNMYRVSGFLYDLGVNWLITLKLPLNSL